MNNNTTPKSKRILAIIGIILLASMYISSLIFAIIGSELATRLLMISLLCTLVIPIFLHFIFMFFKLGKKEEKPEEMQFADDKDDPFSNDDK